MLINLLFNDPIIFAIIAGILVMSLSIHEFAHAYVADRLGDPTANIQGRITLNPLSHLDPLGTIALLFVGFGWGKPVMVDTYNLKNPVKDMAIIAAAGPISNIILAVIAVLAGMLIPSLSAVIYYVVYFNVLLAVFNMVPVTPLDGSKILMAVLPQQTAHEYESFMHQYGTWLLLALIVPWGGSSAIGALISPVIQFITTILLSFL